jgi:hypothetical protein
MNDLTKITAAALAALTLSACVEDQTTRSDQPPMRDASGIAETACMEAVNRNYGGNVRDLRVASSEFSQANSVVMINAMGVRGGNQTERWRCLVSNDGNVEELSVVQ